MAITKDDLLKIKDRTLSDRSKSWIKVGYGTCGVAAGADEVYRILVEEAKSRNLAIKVQKCGCQGLCSAEPLVEVNVEGAPHVYYGKVSKDVAHKIMEEHVCHKKLIENHIYQF